MNTRQPQDQYLRNLLISWPIAFATTYGVDLALDPHPVVVALIGIGLGYGMYVVVSFIRQEIHESRRTQQEQETDDLTRRSVDRLRALGTERGAALADEIERGRARRKSS